MQSILRWSIENSTPFDSAPSDRPPVERKDLDPGIIDMILGKPDSVQMKEDISIATDATRSEDERIDALDHLEMLIEHIDNANDLVKLGLWEPLQALATAESSTTDIKTQALWVIGTALQNNPSAQDVYLSYDPLPALLSFLDYSTCTSISTRAKAIYTISGLLKHNAPAVEALSRPEVNGWTKLQDALQDPSIAVRRKVIFLLSSLLHPTSPASYASTSQAPASDPRIIGGSSGSTSTAITSVTSVDAPNILTPDQAPAAPSNPIFANSHAAHLQHPSRTSTSHLTLSALEKYNVLNTVVILLVTPLPHGEDGENVGPDPDFEEKAVHLVYVYAVACQRALSKAHKNQLKSWIQTETQSDGEKQLLERWNLSRDEYAALMEKLL